MRGNDDIDKIKHVCYNEDRFIKMSLVVGGNSSKEEDSQDL